MGRFNPCELSDFARYYGFHYDGINSDALIKEILVEMERGLAGKTSSLPMIPSYITPVSGIPPGKTVLALDAGGTNLRASLVQFNEKGEAIAQGTKKLKMPGTSGRVSAQQFFDEIADAALPLLKEAKVEGIGFTFSYHTEITSDADGIVIGMSKEVDAPDVTGKLLGKELRNSLASKGFNYDGRIVILNDTTATLLCGLTAISSGNENIPSSPVIGFILGTGCNTAYPETNIPKINFHSPSSPQIIVCESAALNIRCRGQLDMEYDSTTKNAGEWLLEKATSGAYLGPLTLHILKQAVREKLIAFKKSGELLAMPNLESKTLSDFLRTPFAAENPFGSLFGKDETDAIAAVQYISSIITERGALLSAAVLAATVKKMNAGFEPYSPVRIAVEGTTYMMYNGMRCAIESHLHQMLNKENPRSYVIAPVEQASLFGAAVAALQGN